MKESLHSTTDGRVILPSALLFLLAGLKRRGN